jgi:hypothetical protein
LTFVIAGEISHCRLGFDDGMEAHLRAGDTVIQNGLRHAWRNKSSEPCHMVAILIGARRE